MGHCPNTDDGDEKDMDGEDMQWDVEAQEEGGKTIA